MQTKQFFSARLKTSQPLSNKGRTLQFSRLWILPGLSIIHRSMMPSAFRRTNLRAVSSGLTVNSSFWVQAQGKRKLSQEGFGAQYICRVAFFMISLRNQMKPASEVVCDPLKAVWQNHSFSGTGFRISVQEDLGSFCSTLLITSGWHQGSYLKRSLFKSNV